MLIGELSRRTGVSARSLRYYEAQGLLEARRGTNGYRAYDEDAVASVRKIRALLRAGLSTEVIRQVLPCAGGERPEFDWCAELREILDGELAAMDAQIDELRRSRGALVGLLGER
ncbi:MerR family transcriptional regulator [Streptomyces sp. ATCC51928]|uniref:MerR family transcriptional regulator n=1 Tax=Streptomyces caviscabies TaxID=90079 RepID=A0ABW2MFJ6_9ACTN|nr:MULTISPECIES: MerR family transcriptional regulator [unclassified Streptomyces]MDX3506712.1 MerR family transcriptional regulator [Streptomyces sp. ATCC51928]MDX5525907.1 MerR family transcriptional regulator [Streptomyces sp. DE06-01C]